MCTSCFTSVLTALYMNATLINGHACLSRDLDLLKLSRLLFRIDIYQSYITCTAFIFRVSGLSYVLSIRSLISSLTPWLPSCDAAASPSSSLWLTLTTSALV